MEESAPGHVPRRVRILQNPRSGTGTSSGNLQDRFARHWPSQDIDISWDISRDIEDGRRKVDQAVRDGIDTILIAGGDGMVNSIGAQLVHTPVALGVLPTGSGNGFARHFGIPLDLAKAIAVLARGRHQRIDVGTVDGRPFFVTCSLAWDAAIAQRFESFPFRGVAPYFLAAAAELITYEDQPIHAVLDTHRCVEFPNPILFTIANLSQYGGGAQIAPQARADDGWMELVAALRQDLPALLVNIGRLFNGTFDQLPQVMTRRFQRLDLHRAQATPIQIDGELVGAGRDIEVRVLPRALKVLVPADDR